ncbi:hypothetical protein DVH05_009230 [Phytophthora capsici]|nr:hypothetical protein DVH05_009230 [Phytophthora capsici]
MDDDNTFPMAMFRPVNDPITQSVTLATSQAVKNRMLKIGLTLAQSSGRCSLAIGLQRCGNAWTLGN